MDITKNHTQDIPKEQLYIYLIDKNKEIQISKHKIKKLEERYLKVFKENKNMRKSCQLLMNSLSKYLTVKPNDEAMLEPDTFKSICDKIIESIERTINKHKEDSIEKFKNADSSNEFTELKSQIASLQQDIYSKDDKITELQEYIEQNEQHNYDLLLNDLQQLSKNKIEHIDDKIAESEKTNMILKLKSEVKELKDALLKKERKDRAKDINESNSNEEENGQYVHSIHPELVNRYTQTQDGQWESKYQANYIHKESQNQYSTNSDENKKTDKEQNIKEYIKELIAKYFHYEEKGLTNEKLLIINAIFDVLQFSYEERVNIEKIIKRKGKFFNFI